MIIIIKHNAKWRGLYSICMPHGGLPAGQYIAAVAIDTDVHTRTRRTTYQDGPVKMTTGHSLDGMDGAVGGGGVLLV